MNHWWLYILAGQIGVLNMVIWGIYGDLLAEPFHAVKVVRSIVLGLIYSIVIFQVNTHLPLAVVAFSVITLERITTEVYKALWRVEDQSKYLIPSDLKIQFIHPLLKKVLAIIVWAMLWYFLFNVNVAANQWVLIVCIGILGAATGAGKDAPYEGFMWNKFWRTPGVTLFVGFGLILLYPTLPGKFLLLALGGSERIISEFYKKILMGRIPGKFNTKHHNKNWLRKRRYLLIPYSLDVIAVITLFFLH